MAIDAPEFQDFYYNWVIENLPDNAVELINRTMWETWVYEPGVAPVELGFATDGIVVAEALAESYILLDGSASPENYTDFFDFLTQQKVAFVQYLYASTPDSVNAELVAFIDNDLNLTSALNPEVKTEWFATGILAGYDPVLDPTYEWLGAQGRIAYVRPLFTALVHGGRCDLAMTWSAEYLGFYNSYVAVRVQRIVAPCYETAAPTNAPAMGGSTPPTDSTDRNDQALMPTQNPQDGNDSSGGTAVFGLLAVSVSLVVAVWVSVLM